MRQARHREGFIEGPSSPHLDIEEALGVIAREDGHPFLVPVHADLSEKATEHLL